VHYVGHFTIPDDFYGRRNFINPPTGEGVPWRVKNTFQVMVLSFRLKCIEGVGNTTGNLHVATSITLLPNLIKLAVCCLRGGSDVSSLLASYRRLRHLTCSMALYKPPEHGWVPVCFSGLRFLHLCLFLSWQGPSRIVVYFGGVCVVPLM
jgi:hypothetical protein